MNILFIEDEKDLLDVSITQLQRGAHTIYPATSIAEARAVLEDESKVVDIVITDHRLPDGLGIQFAIEIRETYPSAKIAIVSGCLTSEDVIELEANGLLYFRKPLLYAKVVESIRKHYALRAQVMKPAEIVEPVKSVNLENEECDEKASEADEEGEAPALKAKLWGLFGKGANPSKPADDK